jgi:hypothetical protein
MDVIRELKGRQERLEPEGRLLGGSGRKGLHGGSCRACRATALPPVGELALPPVRELALIPEKENGLILYGLAIRNSLAVPRIDGKSDHTVQQWQLGWIRKGLFQFREIRN